MAFRPQLRKLLKEYSLEEILETCEVEAIDALEYLVDNEIVDLTNVIEPTDVET